MNKRFRNFWLTLKMFWSTFSRSARVAVLSSPLIFLLLFLIFPDREFWLLLCGVVLVLSPLTILAVYLLFKEIK